MIDEDLEGVEFISVNTDAQALKQSKSQLKIQIGKKLTRGLGAGARPEIGRQAIEESRDEVRRSMDGADLVFVTAGMGGGTGTGAAPIIAEMAREMGALTIGVVTRPFLFEGRRRNKNAENGVQELIDSVDTIITIPNQKLLSLEDEDLSLLESFQRADDVLVQAVRGISDLIVNAGMINVDFADVKTIMSTAGRALMGTGFGKGERRAIDAAEMAINSPLLDDVSVEGATGILINFTAGPDIKLREINEAASLIQQAAHEEANIIFGVVTDPDMSELVKVTVIATGFDVEAIAQPEPPRSSRTTLPMQRPASRPHERPSYMNRGETPREMMARGGRRPSEPSQQVLPDPRASARAFGASALHDEAVLDIPAYLRRNASQE
jgi:cell division protein FtsZ